MNHEKNDALEPTPYLVKIMQEVEQDILHNGVVDAGLWEDIIDLTEIDKEGIDAKDLLKRL